MHRPVYKSWYLDLTSVSSIGTSLTSGFPSSLDVTGDGSFAALSLGLVSSSTSSEASFFCSSITETYISKKVNGHQMRKQARKLYHLFLWPSYITFIIDLLEDIKSIVMHGWVIYGAFQGQKEKKENDIIHPHSPKLEWYTVRPIMGLGVVRAPSVVEQGVNKSDCGRKDLIPRTWCILVLGHVSVG